MLVPKLGCFQKYGFRASQLLNLDPSRRGSGNLSTTLDDFNAINLVQNTLEKQSFLPSHNIDKERKKTRQVRKPSLGFTESLTTLN